MRVVIAAGGTGGHTTPALAVAEALGAADPGAVLAVVGRAGGPEALWVAEAQLPFVGLPLRRAGDGRAAWARVLTRLPRAYRVASRLLRSRRPEAVLAAGGYVTLPVALAALRAGVPLLLLEQNARPGRTVARLARRAAVVATAYPETAGLLPGARSVRTGSPIRAEVTGRLPAALGASPRRLLVMGGSQGAHRLNQALWVALDPLLDAHLDLTVTHLTGPADADRAAERRAALAPERRDRYRPAAASREIGQAIAASDLVVMRAGGSSIAEVSALGRPMLLVPYPFAGAHQVANAAHLAGTGAARVLDDAACTGPALAAAVLALVDAPGRWAAMAAASRAFGRPQAARAVVELLEALAAPGPNPAARGAG